MNNTTQDEIDTIPVTLSPSWETYAQWDKLSRLLRASKGEVARDAMLFLLNITQNKTKGFENVAPRRVIALKIRVTRFPKKVTLNVPPEIYAQWQELSELRGDDMNKVITDAILTLLYATQKARRWLMLKIWQNFVKGRKKSALVGMFAFISSMIAIGFSYDPWWLYGPLHAVVFVFLLPTCFYLIDAGAEDNPGRPKTPGNLGRTLIGR